MNPMGKSNVGARGGEHTRATVEHNVIMGSWDMAMWLHGKDEGSILGHNL